MIKKSELISRIIIRTGDTKKATEKFLNVFMNIIREKLKAGEEVEVEGLGTFRTSKRDAYRGRNPQTGEEIDISEVNAIYFKPDDKFKSNVNI